MAFENLGILSIPSPAEIEAEERKKDIEKRKLLKNKKKKQSALVGTEDPVLGELAKGLDSPGFQSILNPRK